MKQHTKALLLLLFFLPLAPLIAQTSEESDEKEDELTLSDIQASAQIAMATPEYLVTAGDVYNLSFAAGYTPINYNILVDTTYKIRVANLAILEAKNKSFLELKKQVETIVSRNYPLSGVQFVLIKPAAFTVLVKGEVTGTIEPKAWPLTRLSEVIIDITTDFSSIRDITIRSIEGKIRTCDLFRAQRFGEMDHDPYVRPGDIITLQKASRIITLTGEVERPGIYQLLSGENLKDLIEYYGNGLTSIADPMRMEVIRYVDSQDKSGNKLYLENIDITSNYTLNHLDTVMIPAIKDLIPVMFFEGALGTTEGVVPVSSTRIPVRFNRGENYASLVRTYRNWFGAVSDTGSAYILRDDERIPINLNPMLYDAAYISDYMVRENDILVIPFRQYFVSVSGAVMMPGRYPYIPDRDWSYYISLAGGFDPARNTSNTLEIRDASGKRLSLLDKIGPETLIEAKNNAFLYHFNRYAPVVTTVLTIITTVLTIITTVITINTVTG